MDKDNKITKISIPSQKKYDNTIIDMSMTEDGTYTTTTTNNVPKKVKETRNYGFLKACGKGFYWLVAQIFGASRWLISFLVGLPIRIFRFLLGYSLVDALTNFAIIIAVGLAITVFKDHPNIKPILDPIMTKLQALPIQQIWEGGKDYVTKLSQYVKQ